MPYNGSGTFLRSYSWASDATNGILIRSDRMDGEDNNFASGLSNAICKDGQTTTTASIPFALGWKTADGTVSAPLQTFTAEPSTGFYRVSSGILGVTTSGVDTARFSSSGFTTGTHYTAASATPLLSSGTANTYYQLSFQNKSSGTTASTDFVATADTGTDTTNYVNLGINSSGYSGTLFNNALYGYLYSQSSNLVVGTVAAKDFIIATNNTEVARFVSGGTVTITNALSTGTTATIGTANTSSVVISGGSNAGNISIGGSDTNTQLGLSSKGTSGVAIYTNSGTQQALFANTSGATNYLTFTGSNGSSPTISTSGGNLSLTSAGGSVTAPTPTSTDNSTKIATTAFVHTNLQTAKAWATFSGTAVGTNAPTAGYNVTNITRNSTGNYTVNFTNSMTDANYVIMVTARKVSINNAIMGSVDRVTAPTTSAAVIGTSDDNGNPQDVTTCYVLIFGN